MDLLTTLKDSPGKIIPAAGDGNSFKQFSQTTVPAIFLAGSLVSHTLIAEEDEGLLSISEYARFAHQMRLKKRQPLILDLQSGFGNPLNAFYAAQKLERNGADIVLLNDQVYPSHTKDHKVTTAADFVGKIRASLDSFDDPKTQVWVKLDGITSYGTQGILQRIGYAANAGAKAVVVNDAKSAQIQDILTERPALPILVSGLPKGKIAGVTAWLDDGSFIRQSQKFQHQVINDFKWEGSLDD